MDGLPSKVACLESQEEDGLKLEETCCIIIEKMV